MHRSSSLWKTSEAICQNAPISKQSIHDLNAVLMVFFIFLHKSMVIDHVARTIFCLECAAFYLQNNRGKKRPPKLQPLHQFIRCWPINFWPILNERQRATTQSSVVCNVAINIYMQFAGKFINRYRHMDQSQSVQHSMAADNIHAWEAPTFSTHSVCDASRFSAFPKPLSR